MARPSRSTKLTEQDSFYRNVIQQRAVTQSYTAENKPRTKAPSWLTDKPKGYVTLVLSEDESHCSVIYKGWETGKYYLLNPNDDKDDKLRPARPGMRKGLPPDGMDSKFFAFCERPLLNRTDNFHSSVPTKGLCGWVSLLIKNYISNYKDTVPEDMIIQNLINLPADYFQNQMMDAIRINQREQL